MTSFFKSRLFIDSDSDEDFSRNSASFLGQSILKDTVMSSRAFQEQSERLKKERIKQVRKQEAEISKKDVVRKRNEDSMRLQEEEKQRKFIEYQKLKEEKKRLENLLEDSYLNIGKAQRDAEETELKRVEALRIKAEKQQRTQDLIQQREKEAREWKQKEEEKKTGPIEEILLRKQIVKDEETKLAHKLAEELKEKTKLEQERLRASKESDTYVHVDKSFGKKTTVTKQNVDFSQTHLHNPVIVKHDLDEQKITASENASKEKEKLEKRIQDKAKKAEEMFKKQKERSLLATEREQGKKAVEALNKELDDIAARERKKRLAASKTNEIGDFAGPVKKKYDELRSRVQIEEDFEKEFLIQEKKPSPEQLPDLLTNSVRSDSSEMKKFSKSKSQLDSEGKENYAGSANDAKQRSKAKAAAKSPKENFKKKPLSSISPKSQSLKRSLQEKTIGPNNKKAGLTQTLSKENGKNLALCNENDQKLERRLEEIDSRLDHLGRKTFGDKKNKDLPEEELDIDQEIEDLGELGKKENLKESEGKGKPKEKSVKFGERREFEFQNDKLLDFPSNKELFTPNFSLANEKNKFGETRNEAKNLNADTKKQRDADSFGRTKINDEDKFRINELKPKKEALDSLADNLIKNSADVLGKKAKPSEVKEEEKSSKIKDKAGIGDIEEYLKEQEQFLAKLDQDRMKLAKKLREEEARSKYTLEANKRPDETKGRHVEQKLNDNHAEKIIENYKKINQGTGNLTDLESKTNALFNKFLKKGDDFENNAVNDYGGKARTKGKEENWGFEERFELGDSLPLREANKKPIGGTTPLKQSSRDAQLDGTPFSELSYSISELEAKSADKRMEDLNAESSLKKSWKSNLDASDSLRYSQSVAGGLQSRGLGRTDNKILIENQNDTSRNSELSEEAQRGRKAAKGVRLDFDVKEGLAEREDKDLPLAELFKKRRADVAKKLEENQKKKQEKEGSNNVDEPKKRTKEEILQQRKEMMKRPDFLQNKPTHISPEAGDSDQQGATVKLNDKKGSSKEPNPELLERLALGKKTKVGKKEMLALTNKNYEMLPEIKKKKEEEKKKEELRKRMEKAKELSQKIRGKKNSTTDY